MSSPGGRKTEKKHRSPIKGYDAFKRWGTKPQDGDYLIAGNCLLSRMREK